MFLFWTIGTLSLFSDANYHQCLRLNKSGDYYNSFFPRPVRTSPSAVRLITAQLLFILSRTSLIAYSPHKGFIFSIKARARPHGSYIENFLPWRRRYEILCSSGENNISWLRAANEWYIVLSRNSLKIFRSYRVFFQVLSHSCCLENAFTSSSFTCPYHNDSKQQTNQVHSAKFEKWESWRRCSIRPLVLHTKSRTLGSKMTPWCSDRIDSESVLVSAINTPVQSIFSVLFFTLRISNKWCHSHNRWITLGRVYP